MYTSTQTLTLYCTQVWSSPVLKEFTAHSAVEWAYCLYRYLITLPRRPKSFRWWPNNSMDTSNDTLWFVKLVCDRILTLCVSLCSYTNKHVNCYIMPHKRYNLSPRHLIRYFMSDCTVMDLVCSTSITITPPGSCRRYSLGADVISNIRAAAWDMTSALLHSWQGSKA